jgi:hypothetical protein
MRSDPKFSSGIKNSELNLLTYNKSIKNLKSSSEKSIRFIPYPGASYVLQPA